MQIILIGTDFHICVTIVWEETREPRVNLINPPA